jgi:hypothetical protein
MDGMTIADEMVERAARERRICVGFSLLSGSCVFIALLPWSTPQWWHPIQDAMTWGMAVSCALLSLRHALREAALSEKEEHQP